tara:strand:+ start:719 stop:916 length:198 start_codon:yes stop_codon:yes gene_type:complete
MKKMAFYKVDLQGNELEYIKEAIYSNRVSRDRKVIKKCNQFIGKTINIKKSMPTTKKIDSPNKGH